MGLPFAQCDFVQQDFVQNDCVPVPKPQPENGAMGGRKRGSRSSISYLLDAAAAAHVARTWREQMEPLPGQPPLPAPPKKPMPGVRSATVATRVPDADLWLLGIIDTDDDLLMAA